MVTRVTHRFVFVIFVTENPPYHGALWEEDARMESTGGGGWRWW